MPARARAQPERIGRYAVLRELGRGSTATVYLAHDPFAGREVALKLFTHAPGDAGLTRGTHRASFLNEAALVGRLQHPHIVALLDAAVEERFSYVAMEYVAGGSLARYVSAGVLLPLGQVLEIAFKLSRALEYAQLQGVIHRDLKPGNVLLTRTLDVKLSDFGGARIEDATHTEITGVGSPAYMSPEHLAERALDHRTDIYSLGVVMFQLLTGQLPFHSPSVAELMRQIMAAEPPRLRALRPGLPEALEAIVARALQKDPGARYPSWGELGRELAALARGLNGPAGDPSEARRFQLVRELPFFRGFGELEIWETLRLAHWRSVPDGATILRQGERGDALCILVEGRVEVTRDGATLATLDPGDVFGEILYFADDVLERGTGVRALGPAVLLEMKAAAIASASDACQVRFNKSLMRLLVARLSQVGRRGQA